MKKEKTYFYEINSVVINVLPYIILAFMCILTFIIVKVFNIDFKWLSYPLLLPILLIPYFIIHEILHSIGYVVNGADFKKVTYGCHLEKGVLCCSCKQNISKKNVMWSLMYPFIFIGVITYVIGLVFNIPTLVLLSIFNLAGCSGDIVMFIAFMKIKDFKFFEYDNPIGFGIITSENLENKKLFGLKPYKEENVTQTLDKKITVSKISIIFLIAYYAFTLLPLLLTLLFEFLEL